MEDGRLDISETPDGYVLSRETPDGTITRMPLSIADVLTLAQSAQSLQGGALARLQPSGTGATAVFASIAANARVVPSALDESLHLEIHAPNGGQTIFELSPALAKHIVDSLLQYLDAPKSRPNTFQ